MKFKLLEHNKKTLKTITLSILLLTIGFIQAQEVKKIKLEDKYWEANKASKVLFKEFKGRKALQLEGLLTVKGIQMKEGSISMDVYGYDERSFAGFFFHQQKGNREDIYLRLHKSNQADAIQYTPIFNSESNWQLYHKNQVAAKFKHEEWNHLKIDFNSHKAIVYLNSKKVMVIHQLHGINNSGNIGLWSLFPSWISNVTITRKVVVIEDKEPINKEQNQFITSWQVSESFLIDELEQTLKSDKSLLYKKVKTDEEGLLAFSKYITKKSSGNFEKNIEDVAIAKLIISTDEQISKKISFDFSDKCIVTLNNKEIFRGNNAFRLKGVQYMGHLNVESNTLNILLNKGENVLRFYVIEKANGWGLKARFNNYQQLKRTGNN